MYKYAHSYLKTTAIILQSFHGEMPFSNFIKQYFSLHKKFGGKDRKAIAEACYSCYRLGKSLCTNTIEEKIKIGIFLCSLNIEKWTLIYEDDWLASSTQSFDQKINFIKQQGFIIEPNDIFNYNIHLTNHIDKEAFTFSHFIQPSIFIRTRPNKQHLVKETLSKNKVDFNVVDDDAIVIKDNLDLNNLFKINKEIVVQDFSSQQLKQLLTLIPISPAKILTIWDCCAASGGKSILAKDVLQNIELNVSDIRPSIIINLKKRLLEANVKPKSIFIADLTKPLLTFFEKQDIIWADVPCTGSGTWGRVPENLNYFNENSIDTFIILQKKIIENTIPHLKSGGYYLYSTCSVFAQENEEMAVFIEEKFKLKLIKQQYFHGYKMKADTMFGALFIKV